MKRKQTDADIAFESVAWIANAKERSDLVDTLSFHARRILAFIDICISKDTIRYVISVSTIPACSI